MKVLPITSLLFVMHTLSSSPKLAKAQQDDEDEFCDAEDDECDDEEEEEDEPEEFGPWLREYQITCCRG